MPVKRRPLVASSRAVLACALVLAVLGGAGGARAEDPNIAAVLGVGREGVGNAEAVAAWRALADSDPAALPELLAAIDEAGPVAANYLRAACEVVAARAGAASGGGESGLPLAELSAFLFDLGHSARARELAFGLIESARPGTAAELVPGFLGDPVPALRRRAVARLVEVAGSAEGAGARAVLYGQAFSAAREPDQVGEIAGALEELGREVDLPQHFGFLMRWWTAGPFDNTGRDGFATPFPPEEEPFDRGAEFEGKGGVPVRWEPFVTADRFGMVDLNKQYSPLKEAVGYAFTTFESETSRPAELRLGCKNAWKVWCNGQFLFGREEYHRAMRIDQYQLPIQLKAGTNTILVKICQNEEEEQWTVEWQFQMRVCDATGTALLSADRKPTPEASEATGAPSARRRPRQE